jgi:hypothetical protein
MNRSDFGLWIQQRITNELIPFNSNDAKRCAHRGDEVAMCLARALYPLRPLSPACLRLVLHLLVASFDAPELIEQKANRLPAMTTCLLMTLAAMDQDPRARDRIARTIGRVAESAGPRRRDEAFN